MILWRVSNYPTLDGTGGMLAAGRWHSRGQPVVYCTLNPATALLETIVHMELDAEDRPEHFQLLKITCDDSIAIKEIAPKALTPDWPTHQGTTRHAGDQWLRSRRSALLRVPSVLVPETWNILINPLHPDAQQLQIVDIYQHPFDTRFFI